jgi:mannose-6-phosphate isomerase-like protein (cupin superfamily)
MDHHFDMADLVARRRDAGKPWMEFLRAGSLSMGLYVLPAGARDLQSPHSEDEVYYIVSGHGMLRVGQADHTARPGTVLFVAAGEEHRFHSITEEMTALVFFAPPEGTNAGGSD